MSNCRLPTGPVPDHTHAHFFRSLFDVTGREWRGSWARLAARMTDFPIRTDVTDKKTLPCWSPCAPWVGAGLARIGALVLDIDEGSALEEALDRCAEWALILHTSWSHRTDAPKFRILLPLSRPVPTVEWRARWELATAVLGLPIDKSCKDPGRRYLLPATPAADAARRAVVALDRAALDLMALPLPPPPALPARPAARPPLHVPARLRDQVVRARLLVDPDSRERAAAELGARMVGDGSHRRATGIVCPACERPSVWFYIAPWRQRRARCNHQNSCGWVGGIDEMLLGWAA